MPEAPLQSDEFRHVQPRAECGTLDIGPEPTFDALSRFAARLCDAPLALLTLIDRDRIWFRSQFVLAVEHLPGVRRLCETLIDGEAPIVVPDLRLDPRTRDEPVVSDPGVRFLAAAPVVLSSGEVLGALCVMDLAPRTLSAEARSDLQDLARHASVLLEMRRTRHTLRVTQSIIDNTSAVIWAKDLDGVYLVANRAYRVLLGRPDADLVGHADADLFPDAVAEERRREIRLVTAGDAPVRTEEVFDGPDGVRRFVSLKLPLRDESGAAYGVACVSTDLTDLFSLQAELEAKNHELERFVYTASHDLKSPIVTILGYVGHLRHDVGAGRLEDLALYGERIEMAAHRMRDHVNDLLELSRIGCRAPSVESVDLDAMARDLWAAGADDASLQVSFVHPIVMMDRGQAVRMLQNLIDNARTHGGGGPIEVGGLRPEGERMTIYVRDHGSGVPVEHRERIFGLFERLDTAGEGTGVGLAIVRRVAELNDGHAWVDDTPGGGATFWVQLPVDAPTRRSAETPVGTSGPADPAASAVAADAALSARPSAPSPPPVRPAAGTDDAAAPASGRSTAGSAASPTP